MPIQIDQSNKIEKTNKDTALSLSNDKGYTILITGKTKRKLQEMFRETGKPRIFVYRTFAAGVVLLLKGYKSKIDRAVIDEEYTGKERVIRSMIYEMLGRFYDEVPEIIFERIGKKSKVHNLAYGVSSKKYKPDKVVKLNEIKKLIFL